MFRDTNYFNTADERDEKAKNVVEDKRHNQPIFILEPTLNENNSTSKLIEFYKQDKNMKIVVIHSLLQSENIKNSAAIRDCKNDDKNLLVFLAKEATRGVDIKCRTPAYVISFIRPEDKSDYKQQISRGCRVLSSDPDGELMLVSEKDEKT